MEVRIESFTPQGNHLKWLAHSLKLMDSNGNKFTEPIRKKKVYYSRMLNTLTDTRSVDVLVPKSTKQLRKLKKGEKTKNDYHDILNQLTEENRKHFEIVFNSLERELNQRMFNILNQGQLSIKQTGNATIAGEFFVREALRQFEKLIISQVNADGIILREDLIKIFGKNWAKELEVMMVENYVKHLHENLGGMRQEEFVDKYLNESFLQELQEWVDEDFGEFLDIALDEKPVSIKIKTDRFGNNVVEAEVEYKKDWVSYSSPSMGTRDLDGVLEHYSKHGGRPIGSGEGSLNTLVSRQNPPPKVVPPPEHKMPIKVRTGGFPVGRKPVRIAALGYKNPQFDTYNTYNEQDTYKQESAISESVGQVVPGVPRPSEILPHHQHRQEIRGGYATINAIRGGRVSIEHELNN